MTGGRELRDAEALRVLVSRDVRSADEERSGQSDHLYRSRALREISAPEGVRITLQFLAQALAMVHRNLARLCRHSLVDEVTRGEKMNLVEQALEAQLPKLAMDFFVVFSRFECALKRSGQYAIGDDSKVEPDWDGFARDLGPAFFKEVIGQEIAPVLIGKPPKKQIKLADGSLGWKDVGTVNNTTDLFLAIRRARNNLAHGAKYQDGGAGHADFVEGSERDDVLLGQALGVLAAALKARPDIHRFFQRY